MSRVNHRLVRPCPNMSRAAAARRPVQFVTNPRVGMHDYARTLHITGPCSQKKKAAKIGSCTTERLEICAIGGSDILQRRALGEAAALLPLRTICSDRSFHLIPVWDPEGCKLPPSSTTTHSVMWNHRSYFSSNQC